MSAVLKKPGLQLRCMNPQDLPAVVAIERRAYAFPWNEGVFGDCLRVGYHCLVCSLDDEAIGYGVMSVAADECHVLNLCIDPLYQRLGLGRRIMLSLLAHARRQGVDTAFLEVRPSNVAALGLYASLGFNEVGVRRGYYPAERGREDALLLACVL